MSTEDYLIVGLPPLITAALAYLGARFQFRRKPTEESDQIASAFSKLVDNLQKENTRHMESIRLLREDAHKMRNQLTKLQAFASALFRHIAVLERQIISLGAEPAIRPVLPEPD